MWAPIWHRFWSQFRPKIEKSKSWKHLWKNIWKIYLLRSKIDPPKIEKYSKTNGGLFKITLLAYPQRGWKSDPKTHHFGEIFGAKIESRSKKSALEIVTKIKSNFNQIFNWFWPHFGPHGQPQNLTFFINFYSWCHSWAILAPRGRPKCSKTAPELDFPRNLYHFEVNFRWIS